MTAEEIRKELETHFRLALEYKGVDSSFAGSLSRSSLYLLSGLGVVIKVGNKLQTISYHSAYPENEERYQQAMLDAGYVAVEPLIEVTDDKP